jgi:hypothetical protein
VGKLVGGFLGPPPSEDAGFSWERCRTFLGDYPEIVGAFFVILLGTFGFVAVLIDESRRSPNPSYYDTGPPPDGAALDYWRT